MTFLITPRLPGRFKQVNDKVQFQDKIFLNLKCIFYISAVF